MDVRRTLRRAWEAWRIYAATVAAFQTAILLSLSYLALVGPVWLLWRVAGRRFVPDGRASTWVTHPASPMDPRRLY